MGAGLQNWGNLKEKSGCDVFSSKSHLKAFESFHPVRGIDAKPDCLCILIAPVKASLQNLVLEGAIP